MKEKTKKALTHDIELIGKRVPVLAVAVLFLVAAGSAALLNNFGEITGDAEVDQAIQLEGEDGDYQFTLSQFDSGATAGDTVVDTVEIHNNLEEDYALIFDSTLEIGDNEETIEDESGTQVDWEYEEGVFLTTTFANYFEEAGPSEYDAEGEEEVKGFDSIDESGDYVVTEDVEESQTLDVDDVTVYAHEDSVTVENTLTVEGDDVEIVGFDFEGGEQGIQFDSSDQEGILIRDNTFEDWSDVAVRVRGTSGTSEYAEVTLENNRFEDNNIAVANANSDDVEIKYNVFTGNDVEAIGSAPFGDSPVIESNRFLGDNGASVQVYGDEGDVIADDNFFYNPFNTAVDEDAGEDVEVKASYAELDEVETGVTTLAVVNDFDVMTSGEFDYELTTTIE